MVKRMKDEKDDCDLNIGDHIELHPGVVLPCDVCLISGEVVVDASESSNDWSDSKVQALSPEDLALYLDH